MSRITSALAVLVSLAMVSTSAGALVCDLLCSLGRAHADLLDCCSCEWRWARNGNRFL